MKKVVYCAAIIILGANSAFACGKYRWSIKTASDPQAQQINVNQIISTTIGDLSALVAPSPLPQNSRVAPTELQVFNVSATIIKVKSEADQDYHLILQDSSGSTMDAEIPDPSCVSQSSPLFSQIQAARAYIDQSGLLDTGTISVAASVTGVGFFDFPHAGGAAENGAELHPVLSVQFQK